MRKNMLKRLTALLTALLMTALLPLPLVSAEGAEPVTAAELEEYAKSIQARAIASEPLNDPASEDAASEDGIAFFYDFATLFADRAEMTADTLVHAVSVNEDEGGALRGVEPDCPVSDLLAAYACTNTSLDGSREGALLYLLGDTEKGYQYGLVLRDGQRVRAVEYGEALPGAEGWRCVSVLYTIQADIVASIRIEGLNTAADAGETQARFEELTELGRQSGYVRVPTSRNGLELTAFSAEDLRFDGLYYPDLQPDSFGGEPEDVIMENEDGTWLRVVEGNGFNAVFSCDSKGKHATILSYTILSPDLEGPRGVRLGDQFHEAFTRFRNGENETNGVSALLYGTEGTAPWGLANYVEIDGGMSLHYVTALPDGGCAELILRYLQNELTEIILHTI